MSDNKKKNQEEIEKNDPADNKTSSNSSKKTRANLV